MYSSIDACACMSGRLLTHSDRDEPALNFSLWIDLHALAGDIYTALDQDERWDNINRSTTTLAFPSRLENSTRDITSATSHC